MVKYQVRLQVVVTADDDGGNAGVVTASSVTSALPALNIIYAPVGLEFVYEPAQDFLAIARTVLNNTFTLLADLSESTDPDIEPPTSRDPNAAARGKFASLYPEKLVLFFSFGSQLAFDEADGHWVSVKRTSNSSGWNAGYVSMRSAYEPTGSQLGRMIGNYMQLRHTFAGEPESLGDVERAIKEFVTGHSVPKSEGLDVFDGDRFSVADTPPDPGTKIFDAEFGKGNECGPNGTIDFDFRFINDVNEIPHHFLLTPDRSLVMSNFECGPVQTLSPHQRTRVRRAVEDGARHRLVSIRARDLDLKIARNKTHIVVSDSGEVAIANVKDGRVITFVTKNGPSKLIAWDVGSNGEITRLGDHDAPETGELTPSVCALALDLVVTATTDVVSKLTLVSWHITEEGHIHRKDTVSKSGSAQGIDLCRVTVDDRDFVVTAFRNENRLLELVLWSVKPDGTITFITSVTGGRIRLVSIGPVDKDCIATHVIVSDDHSKVILWRVTSNSITRMGEALMGSIELIAGSSQDLLTLVTAIRRDRHLRLVSWQVADDQLTLEKQEETGNESAGTITLMSVCRVGTELAATAMANSDGKLEVTLWEIAAGGKRIIRHDRDVDDHPNPQSIAICSTGRGQVVTACTEAGRFRLSSWTVS